MESRRQYYQEIFTNPEITIPSEFTVPEKPEDWISFEIPEELVKKAAGHEDKIMIGKWTFVKPELTFHHLKNICDTLEEHYMHLHMIPVLKLLEFFALHVLEVAPLAQVFQMKLARLLLNLGLEEKGTALKKKIEETPYSLSEEEKKVEYEKIKGLRDLSDDINDKNVSFPNVGPKDAVVLETVQIHEVWLLLSEELLKWGDYVRAKVLIKEAYLHSRILKD